MGSIFGDPVVTKRPASIKQQRYLQTRKTDRKNVVKHEQKIQLDICDWMREFLPGVHFRSDTASGAFNSRYEKDLHNRQQSSTCEPDLTILAARRGYHGLVIELKADGVNLKMKRNGTKIRIVKDARGRIIERDYKIRLKGDWASLHIENQAKVLEDYNRQGYLGRFGVGYDKTLELICWYFEIELPEKTSLF